MSSENVENLIRNNVVWSKLPNELQVVLGNSQREYDKRILEYSIRNQLRYKDNIVRFVKKNEEEYYENLLSYSQNKLMLYPYHLSDILVRELRVTPFTYYSNMMIGIMQAEKSYDSLPNFTAADSMQILGIGRNQYIDIINASRSNKKLFRRSKSIKEILPQKPASTFLIEPWHLICYGCILENDVKFLSSDEKKVIDQLVDCGSIICGTLDKNIIIKLINRGLVYLDVPIKDDDYVYVTILDGFVMNRVLGDYFETLLYKIFVAVDGQTSVKELAETIGIDQFLVKNALSVFCRLGFAKKRVTGLENLVLHKSWLETTNTNSNVLSPTENSIIFLTEPTELTTILDEDDELITNVENLLTENNNPVSRLLIPNSVSTDFFVKRIAFVFDSTLTAFLMMGNLSTNLKNHAVTLFEVGKLSDEALDSFINELQNVNFFVEGEVHRYSEHAKTLLHTIQTIKMNNELDLIRGESLWNLDENARARVMQKCYKLIVSIAPLNVEACSLPTSIAPHLGTPSIEVVSAWFRLFLYEKVKNGPASVFLPMGYRLLRLPFLFWKSKNLLLNQGTHEPIILSTDNSLLTINELLESSPVLIQSYGEIINDCEIVNVPFSFAECKELSDKTSFYNHPVVTKLKKLFNLDKLCGYIVLLKLYNSSTCIKKNETKTYETIDFSTSVNSPKKNFENDFLIDNMSSLKNFNTPLAKDPRKICSKRLHLKEKEKFSDYVLLDCIFGVPLFDDYLNKTICHRIIEHNLLDPENFEIVKTAVQNIESLTKNFMNKFQENALVNLSFDNNFESVLYPTNPVVFNSLTNECFSSCDLF